MPFHTLLQSNLVSGFYGLQVSPNSAMSLRASVEADVWAHFRMTSLKFRLHPGTFSGTPLSAGYIGGLQDTPPTTIPQVMELLPSTYLSDEVTKPTEWVSVGKGELAGPFPWYKTVGGSADPTEESPGSIYIAGTSTDAFALEIRGVFEFKTAVAAANTPVAIKARQQLHRDRVTSEVGRERAVLLRLLGLDPRKLALLQQESPQTDSTV